MCESKDIFLVLLSKYFFLTDFYTCKISTNSLHKLTNLNYHSS